MPLTGYHRGTTFSVNGRRVWAGEFWRELPDDTFHREPRFAVSRPGRKDLEISLERVIEILEGAGL